MSQGASGELQLAVRRERMRKSVSDLVDDLMESSYCEHIFLTLLPSARLQPKALRYLEYIEPRAVASPHALGAYDKERLLGSIADGLSTHNESAEPASPCTVCVREKVPVQVDNALADRRFDLVAQHALGLSAISQLHVPIMIPPGATPDGDSDEKPVIGVISLINKVSKNGRAGVPFKEYLDVRAATDCAASIVAVLAQDEAEHRVQPKRLSAQWSSLLESAIPRAVS